MLSSHEITEIFCSIDDYCQDFLPIYQKGLLSTKKRIRPSKLHLSEIMTIQVLFHFSGYRKFTIIASQLPVSKWYDIIGESTMADAIPDRLAHSAHRIELKGESLRKNR